MSGRGVWEGALISTLESSDSMVTGGMQETDGDIGSGGEPLGPGLSGTICVSHLRTLGRGKSSPPPPIATLRKISEIWG